MSDTPLMQRAVARLGIREGQVYAPADGSQNRLVVRDVTTYEACDDVVVFDRTQGIERRIDAFKLAVSRYTLVDESTPEERRKLLAALQAGTATEAEQHKAADLLQVLQGQVETLTPAARRGEHLVEHGAWHRDDSPQDGPRAWLAVRVADTADLSCKPFRERAVDQAIESPKLR